MIDWLNINQGATLALLTAIYVLATIVLVMVTVRGTRIAQQSLAAIERFERERARPYVTLSLINQPLGTIQLRIENVGATAAYNISITTQPEIMILEGGPNIHPPTESEKRHPFIAKGIAFLPPKALEMNVVALAYERFEAYYPSQHFEGFITYTDKDGYRYKDPLVIDLSSNAGLSFITVPEVGAELHKIRELLERKKA